MSSKNYKENDYMHDDAYMQNAQLVQFRLCLI